MFRAMTPSGAQLGPFEVGQISALNAEGYSYRDIADAVTKPNGTSVLRYGIITLGAPRNNRRVFVLRQTS